MNSQAFVSLQPPGGPGRSTRSAFFFSPAVAIAILCAASVFTSSEASANPQQPVDSDEAKQAGKKFAWAKTSRSSPTNTDRGVIWFHSDKHVHFVLYHAGFLQTGLNYSQDSGSQHQRPLWRFRGHVNAMSGRKPSVDGKADWQHRRKFAVAFDYTNPGLALKIDQKELKLEDGRVIVLSHSGPPMQLKIDPPAVAERNNKTTLVAFSKRVQQAIDQQSNLAGSSNSASTHRSKLVSLSGRVVPPNGKPDAVSGYLMYRSKATSSGSAGNAGHTDGRFSFQVPAGVIYLSFQSEDYATAWTEKFALEPGESRDDIILQLSEGFDQQINVVSEDGQPIADATVITHAEVYGRAEGSNVEHTTGKDGAVTLRHFANTRYAFTVKAQGFQPLRSQPLNVDPNEKVRLVLEKANPATGQVVGTDRKPIANARLRALVKLSDGDIRHYTDSRRQHYFGTLMGETNVIGQFDLDSLADDATYMFIIEGPDEARVVNRELKAGARIRRLILPARVDLKIHVIGDPAALPQRQGRPYVSVRQRHTLLTDAGQHGTLIGADVYLKPTPDGGTAVYRGLAIDPDLDGKPQQVEVTLGYKRSTRKIVEFSPGDQPSITFELPAAKAASSTDDGN